MGRNQVQEVTVILGIDPGLSGGLAWWDGTHLQTMEVPTFKSSAKGREVDWAAINAEVDIRNMMTGVDHVYLERVGSRRGEGISSAFKFGYVAGGLRGMMVAYGFPITLVTPQQWKKSCRVNANKDSAVARASDLFPGNASDFRGPKGGLRDGPAEAALIAWYGYNELTRR